MQPHASSVNFLVEFVVFIVLFCFNYVKACILAVLPANSHYKNVRDKQVLITGAGSGLGRLMAIRFAKFGSHLILWDVNESANLETAEIVKKFGVDVICCKVDLSVREDIYAVAKKVLARVKKVDILVNNAGIVTGRRFMDCSDELIEKTMQVNTMAHFWTVKAFLPAMLKANDGHIVTIASLAGLVGCAGLADYCASKFGAVGFDEALRFELESQPGCRIQTTVVCPIFINTGMFDGVVTKWPTLLPILDPDFAVSKIMDAILTNSPVLFMPRITYLLAALKGMLPAKCASLLLDLFGAYHAMDQFKGREKGAEKTD